MNAVKPPSNPKRNATYRWIRQLHLWIGAWGALAAILYGLTGLVMNHRFGEGAWPQGDSSELGKTMFQVPAESRSTPEALSLWLKHSHSLDAQVIRKAAPGSDARQPQRWTFSGGTAGHSWSVEFAPGGDTAELKRHAHSPLAALNRLHKAVGGGWAWTLLADSFAIGMLLLGLSGIWMWARGRSPRQMIASVLGVSVLAFGTILLLALMPAA